MLMYSFTKQIDHVKTGLAVAWCVSVCEWPVCECVGMGVCDSECVFPVMPPLPWCRQHVASWMLWDHSWGGVGHWGWGWGCGCYGLSHGCRITFTNVNCVAVLWTCAVVLSLHLFVNIGECLPVFWAICVLKNICMFAWVNMLYWCHFFFSSF